jgi:hypothetical protein
MRAIPSYRRAKPTAGPAPIEQHHVAAALTSRYSTSFADYFPRPFLTRTALIGMSDTTMQTEVAAHQLGLWFPDVRDKIFRSGRGGARSGYSDAEKGRDGHEYCSKLPHRHREDSG